jgi:hypothetical protein
MEGGAVRHNFERDPPRNILKKNNGENLLID